MKSTQEMEKHAQIRKGRRGKGREERAEGEMEGGTEGRQ